MEILGLVVVIFYIYYIYLFFKSLLIYFCCVTNDTLITCSKYHIGSNALWEISNIFSSCCIFCLCWNISTFYSYVLHFMSLDPIPMSYRVRWILNMVKFLSGDWYPGPEIRVNMSRKLSHNTPSIHILKVVIKFKWNKSHKSLYHWYFIFSSLGINILLCFWHLLAIKYWNEGICLCCKHVIELNMSEMTSVANCSSVRRS